MRTRKRTIIVVAAVAALAAWPLVASRVGGPGPEDQLVALVAPPVLLALYVIARAARHGHLRGLAVVLLLLLSMVTAGGLCFLSNYWQSVTYDQSRLRGRNLAAVGRAFVTYAQTHHGRFPESDRWVEAIGPYLQPPARTRCPAQPASWESTYTMNPRLSGTRLRGVADRSSTILLSETMRAVDHPRAGGSAVCSRRYPRGPGDLIRWVATADGKSYDSTVGGPHW
jgi:hypothetical protein